MGTIIKGSFPFVLIMLMSLFILVILPELATWLPALML
jgi:TRAP-type C4-dicarboxylate transport system permease large subunit